MANGDHEDAIMPVPPPEVGRIRAAPHPPPPKPAERRIKTLAKREDPNSPFALLYPDLGPPQADKFNILYLLPLLQKFAKVLIPVNQREQYDQALLNAVKANRGIIYESAKQYKRETELPGFNQKQNVLYDFHAVDAKLPEFLDAAKVGELMTINEIVPCPQVNASWKSAASYFSKNQELLAEFISMAGAMRKQQTIQQKKRRYHAGLWVLSIGNKHANKVLMIDVYLKTVRENNSLGIWRKVSNVLSSNNSLAHRGHSEVWQRYRTQRHTRTESFLAEHGHHLTRSG